MVTKNINSNRLVIDNTAAPSVESDITKERMDYLKMIINVTNAEAHARAIQRGDIKKITEAEAAIAKAELAMQRGNKEEIISMAKEAIKTNAENIKKYDPYFTAAGIAKKYLSADRSESVSENMTEEDIKKVCVINYFYTKNAAKDIDANFSEISDVERSAGVIKALCEKLYEDRLVPSADYFDSLIYKRNTAKELDKNRIKGMVLAALSMSIADRQSPVDETSHNRVLNEITSVPSDLTDLKQLQAWKETVTKYYSQEAK